MASSPAKGRTGQSARTAQARSRASNGNKDNSNQGNRTAQAAGTDQAGSQQNGGAHLVDQMKQQHRDIEAMLTQPGAGDNLEELVERLAEAWLPHTLVEEQILLPAMQRAGATEPAIAEAEVRRDLVKVLLADLREDPETPDARPNSRCSATSWKR